MSIDQYLARHASPEIALADAVDRVYDHVLVVPARDEPAAFTAAFADAMAGRACLLIVVVNATDDAGANVHAANAALIEALSGRDGVLCVDRASPGARLPGGQGVGLARGIGCDIALALYARGALATPWIHTTDADAHLAADYFDAPSRAGDDAVALVYPFEHDAPDDDSLADAARAYDTWLRYYVEGLRWARSPYAFHTVGSTIAVRADAYAAVRGIPPRQAGEDFYLLNKLAKVGAVAEPSVTPIRLSTRASSRVPFGTGPGIARFAAELAGGREPRFYHPRSFDALAVVLAQLDAFAASAAHRLDFGDDAVARAANALGVAAAAEHARRATTGPAVLRRRLTEWFDGFRTRKLIHALRAHGLADVAMSEALDTAPFWPPRPRS